MSLLSRDRLFAAGALGSDIVLLSQLLSVSQLDDQLRMTMWCLTIAIPSLSGMIVMSHNDEVDNHYRRLTRYCFVVGITMTATAFETVFWHFAWEYAALFLAAIMVCAIFFAIHLKGDEV
jgi:predicted MFS family arabinose efflux permease